MGDEILNVSEYFALFLLRKERFLATKKAAQNKLNNLDDRFKDLQINCDDITRKLKDALGDMSDLDERLREVLHLVYYAQYSLLSTHFPPILRYTQLYLDASLSLSTSSLLFFVFLPLLFKAFFS